MKVLEISPGNGWYSEILSNFLKDTNSFYVSKYKIPPVKVVGENQKKFDEYFSKVREIQSSEIQLINTDIAFGDGYF